jgi:hypothetical protein
MPATKEKGRLPQGSPIPKCVLADATEYAASPLNLQVSRLTRFAISETMAEALAPLAFGVPA